METRQYKDVSGNPCSLDWLVRNEPGWASNQIRNRDKLEAENKTLKETLNTMRALTDEERRLADEFLSQQMAGSVLADWQEARRLFRKTSVETDGSRLPGGYWDLCVRMWDDFDRIIAHLEMFGKQREDAMTPKQKHFSTEQQCSDLAEAIAVSLFTSGDGKVADRLIFRLGSGEAWGGWSQPAAKIQIEKVINELNKDKTI